jgi:16S rRNA (guanine527-N7)-methyltransferase
MSDEPLIEALGQSQRLGMLGDLPINDVIRHARLFTAAFQAHAPNGVVHDVADIGSGGGVPGLVLAVDLTDAYVTLIDRRAKRTDHLQRLVRRLGLQDRVTVIAADLTSPPSALRGAFDAVSARGFGPPSVTLELGAPLLRRGGLLAVSEPPAAAPDRWDPSWLECAELDRCTPLGAPVAVFHRR